MGPNILIAIFASNLAKPDGLSWITEDMAANVLETIPVKKLWGVGQKTPQKLRAMGITVCENRGKVAPPAVNKKVRHSS